MICLLIHYKKHFSFSLEVKCGLTCLFFSKSFSWMIVPCQEGPVPRIYTQPLAALKRLPWQRPACWVSEWHLQLLMEGIMFKKPGGNTLALDSGVGTWRELRVVSDFHSSWISIFWLLVLCPSSVWGHFPDGPPYTLPSHDWSFKAPNRKGLQSHDVTKAQDCRKPTAIPEGYRPLSCPLPCQLPNSPTPTNNRGGKEERGREEKYLLRTLLHSRDHSPQPGLAPHFPAWALQRRKTVCRWHDAICRKS